MRAAEFHESGLTISCTLLNLQRQLLDDCNRDFVALSTASDMKSFVICILGRIISAIASDEDFEFDESSMRDPPSGTPILDQMVRGITALKLRMSVAAVFGADGVLFDQEGMDSVSDFVASVLDKVIEHFPFVDQVKEKEKCLQVVTDLLQVLRALMTVCLSSDNAPIRDSISRNLVPLFRMCSQLIIAYSTTRGMRRHLSPSSKAEEDEQQDSDMGSDIEQSTRPAKRSEFSSESSDSEGGIKADDRKRRRSSNSWNRKVKPRKDSAEQMADNYPSYLCAIRLASIMILLQPTHKVCSMVARLIALPRQERGSDRRQSRGTCDLDVQASLHCLVLFCSEMVIHRKENLETMPSDSDNDMDETGSIVSLCCHLILQMRDSVGPSSVYYLFGFEVCADLVSHREKAGGSKLDLVECKDIVELLGTSSTSVRKMLKVRPMLRERQLAAATTIIRSAREGENMHSAFDNEYKQELIINLCDLYESVRRRSTYAVGAALCVFPQGRDTILATVKKNLPPLLPTEYRRWYEKKNVDAKSNNLEAQVWEGALYSIQASSIAKLGVATGSTSAASSMSTFRLSLFEMIKLASERPDLEALSFRACEKVAELAGFGTVHKMFLSESEFLVESWLDTGKKLVDLPLLLTAPTVLLKALKAGTARYLLGPGVIALSNGTSSFQDDERQSAMDDVRLDAAKDYVERSINFLVPITCIKVTMSSDDEHFRDYLKEISDIVVPKNDGTSLSKMIRAHLSDILSFVEPLRRDTNPKSSKYGEEIVKMLEELIKSDVYEHRRTKDARLTVRRLLQRLGGEEHSFGEHCLSRENVEEAIKSMLPGGLEASPEEPFAAIGSSVTEYLLYSRFWLLQSVLVRQKQKRWSSIDLVCSFSKIRIMNAISSNTQLGCCIHTIVEVLAEPLLACIYPQALTTLNDLLSEVFIQLESAAVPRKFESEILAEMSTVLYRLIGTLLITHERCQNALIEECLLSWEKEREFVRRSQGLWLAATTSSTGGVWGWDDGATKEERIQEVLGKFGCNDCLYSTLVGTYDALERLLGYWRILKGKSVAPMSSLSSFASKKDAYGSFERRNPKLCAQTLVGAFLCRIELPEIARTKIEDGVSDFLNAVRGLMMNYSTLYSRRRGGLQHREHFLTVESRLLLDELRCLQGVLDNLPGNPMKFSFRVSNLEQCYSLVRTLVNICEMSYAEDIRAAACQCLGALGPCEIERLGSIELELSERVGEQGKSRVDGGDHLQKIMSSCLEMLGQYLLSPRIETAVTALQSAKAIVASPGGNKCWELISNEDCKRSLAPLVESARKVATGHEGATPKPKQRDFVLPTLYVDSLITRASSGVEFTIPDLNWCWREGLWKLDEKGDLSYEEWVKGIACAMIHCCYSDKDETQTGANRVRGSATFFRCCVKLCALEHEFAARAFPGIVLDLLLNSNGGKTPSDESTLRKLNRDPSSSFANKRLSECISLLINCASSDRKGGKLTRQSPPIKAVSLAVETLDMLRMITQAQFLASSLETRRSRWNRAPYGVVLCLDGLQVADACMRVNRFASAVFYADMYADEFYGGAGGSMERLANGEMSGSFRGTNAASLDGENYISATTFDEKLSLPSILLQSFTALGDYDAAGAIEIENAAMGFLDPEFMWNANSSLRADVLDRLKALDAQCHSQNGSAPTGMQIVKCMEDIGLESVLHTYIHGMVADQDGGSFHELSPVDQSSLRDLWFRGCMTSMQWNQDFFNASFAAEPSKGRVGFGDAPSNLHWGSDTADCGFHECLSKALSSFLRDDSVAFRRLLTQARTRLMHDAFLIGGGEAPLRGMISSVDRMQLLNDLDGLTSMAPCRALALKWQEQNESALGGSVIEFPRMASANPLRLDEFVVSIREVMLRAFQAKNTSSSGHDFNECLVSHLWQISAIARRVGCYDIADPCVQRLHTALRIQHPTGLEKSTLLRLRHEEAMIMESRGDFSAAIRGLRRLSSHLEKEINNADLSSASVALYADALLTCGQWVSRFKVEPGMSIRQNYLERAAKLASKIYKRDEKNRHTAHRSFEAHLSLAQLVLGMYDNARQRVESPEWEKAGNIVEAKKTELENCKVLKGAAEKALKNKRKRQPSDEKKYHDLCASMIPLEKELIMMQEERKKTESSVQVWLQQGLQAYGNALACASTGESSDITRHIYRVVSLWFANCDRATVNEAMKVVVQQIPSFRFVPLVYQIFSRIGGQPGDGERDNFQDILKKQVFRMSIEHPYHCIVQLLALSNGKNVGAGVGGRAAETYLENVDDAKVAAAIEIIGCLEQQSEVPYVAGLVDPYRVLVAAYIRLANASTKTFEDKRPKPQLHGIPINKVVTKRDEQLDKCLRSRGTNNYSSKPCVLTMPPLLSAGGEYGGGIEEPAGSEFVAGFDDFFSITLSGISRPKILFCIGSKKGRFKQVVKGGDDIRQDAVMQQVFCYVNELMKRRDEASIMGGARGSNSASRSGITRALKHHLNVVTYSIVPLSPTSGVLEWAKDTRPFGDIVKTGVHSRYYPGEWTYGKCKDLMMNATTATEKRKQFDEICKNVTPAFRFFFTERFMHSLPQWYAAKMKYTRSCAVSSMVGHVLGIGDRHMHNILIRETTGEVVHIDFGIVFEQGKVSSYGRVRSIRFYIKTQMSPLLVSIYA
jgi:ataxia telangiectasia mutated family protein